MKNALREKLNEALPQGLKPKVVASPQKKLSQNWPILVPVALSLVLTYFAGLEVKQMQKSEAQEERIVDEFIQDMNEFDHELEDDMASYL